MSNDRRALSLPRRLLGLALVPLAGLLWSAAATAETATVIPPPQMDQPLQSAAGSEKAVLAGGCVWGVQAVFQHVKGVSKVLSGYSGGTKETADYGKVSSGRTGHAEAVEVIFDPAVVSYGTLLQIFFSVAHDPTQLNRQGPDVGPQYRSEIFASDANQKRVADAYIAQLDKAGVYSKHIVTKVGDLAAFYPAEAYHQDYATLHPNEPYIRRFDLPKIDNVKRLFPSQVRSTPVLVGSAPKG
jgi:peptide-methionine (S)-S-oxide reductase